MIFSNHPDFLQGMQDWQDGEMTPPASVINEQMWSDGFAAAKTNAQMFDEDELFLMELND